MEKLGRLMSTKRAICTVLFLSLLFTLGCVDARIKRAASLANTKTQVEAREFESATTPEEKLKIADRHFKTLPKFTQILDDYVNGRKPVDPEPKEIKAP